MSAVTRETPFIHCVSTYPCRVDHNKVPRAHKRPFVRHRSQRDIVGRSGACVVCRVCWNVRQGIEHKNHPQPAAPVSFGTNDNTPTISRPEITKTKQLCQHVTNIELPSTELYKLNNRTCVFVFAFGAVVGKCETEIVCLNGKGYMSDSIVNAERMRKMNDGRLFLLSVWHHHLE